MESVVAMSGVPGEPDFLAISVDGLLQTMEAKKELTKVFPKMEDCDWSTVVSIGLFSVVAGKAEYVDLHGKEISRTSNFFLLVRLEDLEVINKTKPLSVVWIRNSSSIV